MTSDLKFAFRSLLKTPGFTVTALLTLALGIGVNTSMFTVTNTLLLQQLPFAKPEQIVRIFRTSPQSQNWPHAVANYLDVKAQSHAFSSMVAYTRSNFNYSAPGQPAEQLQGMDVTGEFFTMLGIGAELGRTFSPEETRAEGPAVVVLSHDCWASRFSSDATIVGRQIRIDGKLVTVIGVMPASFVPRLIWGPLQIWRPLIFSAAQQQDRDHNFMAMLGRLAPGVSAEQAATEMNVIAARLAQEHPLTNSGNGLRLASYAVSPDNASRLLTWFVMGLAGFVLLIACANLANLQFARTAGRSREYAIRIALGAPRWRIMRELLVESLLLAFVGGAGGLLIALWSNDLIGSRIVVGPNPGLALPLDPRVFTFALAVSVLSGLTLGLLPAWSATRTDVNDALKQQSRGSTSDRSHHRMRHALIVAEFALALMLLAGAGVFISGLQRFTGRDPGWKPDNLLIGSVSLPDGKYTDEASRRNFFEKLDRSLIANPLLQHVAIASSLPITGYSTSTSFVAENKTPPPQGSEPLSNLVFVSPGFFGTIGVPLQKGRGFTVDDRTDKTQVVVINEAMARNLWPGEEVIGKRLGDPDPANRNWLEIVGVVGNVVSPGDVNPPDTRFQMYRPITQQTFNFANIAVRGQVAPEMLAGELRRAVAAIDADQPVYNIVAARAEIERGMANYHLRGALLGGFAVLGLALAAIGIYGVLAGFVAQRRQEIGIRMALGAQVRDVLHLVLGRGLLLALGGTGLGLIGAFGVVRLLGRILPELGSPNLLTLAGVVVTLLAVAFVACWLPARRATKVDPMVALRSE
jgi:putative ABC transport system permease protein